MSQRPRRRGRWRILFSLCLLPLVGLLCVLVYFYVLVTQHFEGRLWQLPARIFSDTLTLAPGDRMPLDDLVRRLSRSGYGRAQSVPERQGQYRRLGPVLDVYVRSFVAGEQSGPPQRLQLRFAGERLIAITEPRGRKLPQVSFEPELLASLYGSRQEERQLVRLDQVPRPFVAAVLAAEDARFFDHHGMDLRGILRAAWANLGQRRIVQGGSTITQQTVKNLFFSQKRSWWRKSREGLMSLMLEARYPKQRILEVYLNEVYLGQRGSVAICGVQAASRFYFGRDLGDLSLGESALLAGLIRSPGRYNPFLDPVKALGRRDTVLQAMQRLGLAAPAEVERARAEQLQLASGSGGFAGAPHAVDFVRAQLTEQYSNHLLYEDGLRIYTTLDTRWQEQAERALQAGLARLQRDVPQVKRQRQQRLLEGAVIVTRPDTGAVLAMVGGRDYRRSQFNRAVQAKRQPGSCFKPFVYAAGFEQALGGQGEGLTPATLLEDSPLELTSGNRLWSPVNDDGQYRGWVSARQALEQSLNVPTVRAAQRVGLEQAILTARRCGISSQLAEVPSLALGTEVITPLELASAYGTLARLGRHVSPWIIREVTDRDGKPLGGAEASESEAIGPQAAFLVNDILRGVFERGTAQSAYALGYTGGAAGKTGTTDDTRDAWFVGYTPGLLALVWVGYDDNAATGLSGASGALPIWTDLMRRAADSRKLQSFREPGGIVRRMIDPASAELAAHTCPEVTEEVFAEGTEPAELCSLHTGRLRRWLQKIFSKRPYATLPGV